MSEAKLYQCHKQVLATPMNRQEYNDYRGWELPADENGADEGFLVEYLDGGESNHPNHDGYISWSPKSVFEKGYTVADVNFIDRMRTEFHELAIRVGKLSEFVNSEKAQALEAVELELMLEQLESMNSYAAVLAKRLKRHG